MYAPRLFGLLATIAAQTTRASWRMRGLTGPARDRAAAVLLHEGALACLKSLGVRIRVEGAPPTGGALVVPNHFSILDAFAVVGTGPMAVAGRAELANGLIAGAMPRTYGIIGVNRARRTATGGFVEEVQARLAAGVPLLVFAEGTTSDGTQLLPFKTGAFEAVAGTEYAVVPVWQRPVRDRYGPVTDLRPFAYYQETMLASYRRFSARLPAEIAIRFGTPIPAAGHTRKTLAATTEAALREMRNEDF